MGKNFTKEKATRAGCRDVWNAYMCEGAEFGAFDIPYCPTTAQNPPNSIVTWEAAKAIYKKHIARKDIDFFEDSFVCWYIDDHKFDGPRGIWHDAKFTLKVLRHFAGAIAPDFSTYQDFPEAIKIYNTYRMRAFGYWLGENEQRTFPQNNWKQHFLFKTEFQSTKSGRKTN